MLVVIVAIVIVFIYLRRSKRVEVMKNSRGEIHGLITNFPFSDFASYKLIKVGSNSYKFKSKLAEDTKVNYIKEIKKLNKKSLFNRDKQLI